MNLEMKVKEIMQKNPIIIDSNESLADVSKKMASIGRDIAVVEENKIVQGFVTASEIFFAMKSYVLGKQMFESIPIEIRDMKIFYLMKTPLASEFMEACGLTGKNNCIVLREENSVADAIRVMAISGVEHILIVKNTGIAGTLSSKDLLKAFK
jgi:predicted transcriptional regulator